MLGGNLILLSWTNVIQIEEEMSQMAVMMMQAVELEFIIQHTKVLENFKMVEWEMPYF